MGQHVIFSFISCLFNIYLILVQKLQTFKNVPSNASSRVCYQQVYPSSLNTISAPKGTLQLHSHYIFQLMQPAFWWISSTATARGQRQLCWAKTCAMKAKRAKKAKKAKKVRLRSDTQTIQYKLGQWLPLTTSGPLHFFQTFSGPSNPGRWP